MNRFLACVFAWLLSTVSVFAQSGPGYFISPNPAVITSPVAMQTVVFNSTLGQLQVYTSGGYVSLGAAISNYTATVAPTASNDNTQGYQPGSVWINTVTQNVYTCVSSATGAAVWVNSISNIGKFTTADWISDFLITGLVGTVPSSSLTMTIPAGSAYVTGVRITAVPVVYTYTASQDTYDYLQNTGSWLHVSVANGAATPSGQPGLLIEKVVTNGSSITSVTQMASIYPTVNVPTGATGSQAISKSQADATYPNLSTAVQTNQANSYTSGIQDFTHAAQVKLPTIVDPASSPGSLWVNSKLAKYWDNQGPTLHVLATSTDNNLYTADQSPAAVGGNNLGTLALPWNSIYLGGAATNNNQIVSGTTTGSRICTLPDANSNPVQPIATVTSKWLNSVSSAGLFTATQPAFTDISGTLVNAQLPTTTVTPGSYTGTNLTVNAQGVITAAANGAAGGSVTSVSGPSGILTWATPTSTPVASAASIAAYSVLGNNTASSAGWGAQSLVTQQLPSTALVFGGPSLTSLRPLLNKPAAPTVTPTGTTGAATWSYTECALDATGTDITAAGAVGTTTTGNATLTASNYNALSWAAVPGATQYRVYRTAVGTSPATTGLVATVTTTSYNDVGSAGDGTTAPAVSTFTGEHWQAGNFSTDAPITATRLRLHMAGNFTQNATHTITVSTEMAGGAGGILLAQNGQGPGGGSGGNEYGSVSNEQGGGGGANGGAGGNGGAGAATDYGGRGGLAYSVEHFLPGSGGGGGQFYTSAGTAGGPGGGALLIEASGNITINANITANGAQGVDSAVASIGCGAGGSGGSAYLVCPNTLTFGAVTISLVGGRGGNATGGGTSTGGGGAGGGRLFGRYATLSNSATVTLTGGAGGTGGGFAATAGAIGVQDLAPVTYSVRSAP